MSDELTAASPEAQSPDAGETPLHPAIDTDPMSRKGTTGVDGAAVEVIRSYLSAAAEEMRTTLIQTSFNPVIYEIFDFGISIYDGKLDLIGEATGLAPFLGANDYAIRKGVEYVGAENLERGDVVVMNYPYWNSAHTSDATVFAPVFAPEGDRPFAYLVVRAHWLDIGAKDPGYVLDSTDMHQEGLVFPGTKIFKAGEPDREILELIRVNSRMPEAVLGDLNAQVAALRTGERRLLELIEKFGEAALGSAVDAILDHGERATLRALAELPHGTWCAEDWLDDDGISDDRLLMRCTVTIASDRFEVDFAGSHGTARGPVNMPFGATIAICKVALKALTSPHEATNGGQMRPLHVLAEPGNLFHAVYPAPTYTLWTGVVALELIFKAIAQGMPDRLPASSGGEMAGYMLVGVHPEDGRLFAISNGEAVGWGATPHHDGADATSHVASSVLRTAPIEVLETKTTMFVERVELRTDTGGAGRFRGGVGVQRDIRFLASGEFLTVGKKTKTRPWAIAGGLETEPNTFVLFPDTERERRAQTQRTPVDPGDRFRVLTAGGGGHGEPRERDPARVREDVLDGYVSPEAAREVYGASADTSTA